jgi:hypothetical protein
MGLPGRPPLARVLLLAMVLACVPATPPAPVAGEPAAPVAAPAGAVDNRRTPPPGSATLPVRGPMRAGAGAFAPGRVPVGFEAGAGEEGRRAAATAVDGRVVAGNGRTRLVEVDRADVVGRVAAGDLLLRARGDRRRRQHPQVAAAPRAGVVSRRERSATGRRFPQIIA